MFCDPKLRADLAGKGVIRARERYGWAGITRQYETLLQSLLE
jgi:hypothetical protein